MAIKHGYTLKLTKALVYVKDEAKTIFKDYINMVFKIKAEEDVFKENKDSRYNPVRRMVSKLLMNSLYGKMLRMKSTTLTLHLKILL